MAFSNLYISLEEARELYTQGGLNKDIALRCYSEGEITNDYTTIKNLPSAVKITHTGLLYSTLYDAYKQISKGREIDLVYDCVFAPNIVISTDKGGEGKLIDIVTINKCVFNVFISAVQCTYNGKLGMLGDGEYTNHGMMDNMWAFREKDQAKHFATYFYKEVIRVTLGDMYNIKFESENNGQS